MVLPYGITAERSEAVIPEIYFEIKRRKKRDSQELVWFCMVLPQGITRCARNPSIF